MARSSEVAPAGRPVRKTEIDRRPMQKEALREKESAQACVQKKREIFLVQMAVETRKAEILKLHEKAARKEEILRAADQQLTAEMHKFDEFLRATDQRAHIAMKEADEVGRLKLEKQQQIRELHERLSACNARISKYEELVQEGAAYKSFLEKLSPPEWLEVQETRRQERLAAKRKKWVEQQLRLQEGRVAKEMQEAEAEVAEKLGELEEKRRRGGKAIDDCKCPCVWTRA
ncbi:coiled-coil protein [Cystoisospora suis]|uniref:Coiled-coil protein n=1 Tax=Cystoisospora suis TaxID=483139 RepID=A0A2C6L3S6_9APIC|nr:coiled-coil protein [Cystoisospora suis]